MAVHALFAGRLGCGSELALDERAEFSLQFGRQGRVGATVPTRGGDGFAVGLDKIEARGTIAEVRFEPARNRWLERSPRVIEQQAMHVPTVHTRFRRSFEAVHARMDASGQSKVSRKYGARVLRNASRPRCSRLFTAATLTRMILAMSSIENSSTSASSTVVRYGSGNASIAA